MTVTAIATNPTPDSMLEAIRSAARERLWLWRTRVALWLYRPGLRRLCSNRVECKPSVQWLFITKRGHYKGVARKSKDTNNKNGLGLEWLSCVN